MQDEIQLSQFNYSVVRSFEGSASGGRIEPRKRKSGHPGALSTWRSLPLVGAGR